MYGTSVHLYIIGCMDFAKLFCFLFPRAELVDAMPVNDVNYDDNFSRKSLNFAALYSFREYMMISRVKLAYSKINAYQAKQFKLWKIKHIKRNKRKHLQIFVLRRTFLIGHRSYVFTLSKHRCCVPFQMKPTSWKNENFFNESSICLWKIVRHTVNASRLDRISWIGSTSFIACVLEWLKFTLYSIYCPFGHEKFNSRMHNNFYFWSFSFRQFKFQ